MLRTTLFTLFAAGAIALVGCGSMTVSSHIERGADFDVYRTYDWGPPDGLPTGDPRLDNNAFFQDYVQGAVEKQLAMKGLERGASGSADLLVHYHANVTQRIDVDATDRQYGYASSYEPHVVDFEQGTLVVDVIDARTNKLVWRGWAQDSVAGVIDDQDRLDRQTERGVTRMFERFPIVGRGNPAVPER